MVAPKYNIPAILLLSSLVHAQPHKDLVVKNQVEGCFAFEITTLDMSKEPVSAVALIGRKKGGRDCPCKSAVMKYTTFQERDGSTSNLMSGQFSVVGRDNVVMPIAVQKQLILPDLPINLSLSCSGN